MSTDALLFDVYGCAAEPAGWPRALDRLCNETGARSAVLQAFSFDGPRARIRWSAQDSRTSARHAQYDTTISDDGNPRLDRHRALRGLNRIARDEELFDPSDEAAPRLQQQLATLGLGRFMGSLQQVGSGLYLGLALHRAIDDHRDFSDDQATRLSMLLPHLGQAVDLGGRLQAAGEASARMQRQFDQLRCGLVACTPEGRVQWLNRSAETLLAAHGTLQVRAGSLMANSVAATATLRCEIRDAAADPASGTGRYLALGAGPQALHVAMQAMSPASATEGGLVLLVVTAAGACSDVPIQALVRLFGLTHAESRLASALVSGVTLEQYAQVRGVSIGTARGQLKQVFAKTGIARQTELVRLVLSSAAAQMAGTVLAEHG